jgi:hypothetical protein
MMVVCTHHPKLHLEAEIGRFMIPGQPRQKNLMESHFNEKKLVWWCVSIIPATVGSLK